MMTPTNLVKVVVNGEEIEAAAIEAIVSPKAPSQMTIRMKDGTVREYDVYPVDMPSDTGLPFGAEYAIDDYGEGNYGVELFNAKLKEA